MEGDLRKELVDPVDLIPVSFRDTTHRIQVTENLSMLAFAANDDSVKSMHGVLS